MPNRWDIFGIGAVTVDDLLYVDHYPQPDEKLPVQQRQRQGGGLTATALVAAARQGSRTVFCGVLGDDELSQFTRSEFEREGVDLLGVIHYAPAKPIHSSIIVDTSRGSRTILYDKEGVVYPEPEQILPEWIHGSRVVFTDHTTGWSGLYAARLAHESGVPVIADIENIRAAYLDEILEMIDHLIVDSQFAKDYTGRIVPEEMVQVLSGPQRAACVVTAGEQGCWYSESGGPVHYFPAFQVPVVDTTGCGDVFHGSYAAAIARGETISRAVTLATATAGMKAAHKGGRAGIPGLGAVEQFLAKQG